MEANEDDVVKEVGEQYQPQSDGDADDENEDTEPEENTPEWEKYIFDKENTHIEIYSHVCLVSKKWYDLWKEYTHDGGTRPGPIDNTDLLDSDCQYAIDRSRIEDVDYHFVTTTAYKKLREWYGGGPTIERAQSQNQLFGTTKVHLYPCIIQLQILRGIGNIENVLLKLDRDDQTLLNVLKNRQVFEASEGGKTPWARLYIPLRLIQEAFRTTNGKDSRANTHYFPENLDKERLVEVPANCSEWQASLGDLQVKDGERFVIEFQDGYDWPSSECNLAGVERNWPLKEGDDLEIGFHCQIMDKFNKWHHGVVVGRRVNEETSRQEYRVHFMRWEAKYDEWVQFTSEDRFKPIDERNDKEVSCLWQGMKKKSQGTKRSAGGNSSSGGYYNYGRSYNSYYNHEEGTPTAKGIVGLRNLGNTCFMNSIIQCLAQSPYLIPYFRRGYYTAEINADNPLGKEGKVAEEWANLLNAMWSGQYRTCVPYDFKKTIGSFSPQFLGYNQQDSQEFLNFLLDGIHEDLNRVLEKPYVAGVEAEGRPDKEVAIEAWERHLMRNQSIIVDLMQGQLKSKVVCPVCSRTSITFDPFMFLSVPVPTDNHKTQIVTWVPAPFEQGDKMTTYGIKIGREDNILQLKTLFKKQTGITVPLSKIICMDVYNGRVYSKEDDEGISGLMESDDIFLYEIEVINQPDEVPPNHQPDIIHVRVSHSKARSRWNTDFFGIPIFFGIDLNLPINADLIEDYIYSKALCFLSEEGERKLAQYQKQNNKDEDELADKIVPVEQNDDDDDDRDPKDNDGENANADSAAQAADEEPGAAPGAREAGAPGENEGDDLDGRDDEFDQFSKEHNPWENIAEMPFQVKWSRKRSQNWGGDPLPMNEFEEGDERLIYEMYIFWEHPRDDYDSDAFDEVENREKDESVPDKRGRSSSYYSPRESKPIALESCMATFTETEILGEDNLWYCNKCREHQRASKTMEIWSANDVLIIHLKRFKYTKWNREKIDREVKFPLEGLDISPWVTNKEASKEECLYDLYGVSNHSGGLGGGHYTAYVRNLESGDWFNCNDSYCNRISDTDQIFGSEAYVLFYKRRNPVSGPKAMQLFQEIPEQKLDEPVHDVKLRDDGEEEYVEGVQGP